jgi:hypothetical protein
VRQNRQDDCEGYWKPLSRGNAQSGGHAGVDARYQQPERPIDQRTPYQDIDVEQSVAEDGDEDRHWYERKRGIADDDEERVQPAAPQKGERSEAGNDKHAHQHDAQQHPDLRAGLWP